MIIKTESSTARRFDDPSSQVIKIKPSTLNTRTVSPCGKPILFVLILLGIGAVGVTGIGMAAFGGHQGWWVSTLPHLNQVNSIIMLSIGGGSSGILTLLLLRNKILKKLGNCKGIFSINPFLKNLQAGSANARLDASYDHADESGICDLVYCDSKWGFGCVVDGSGHNSKIMKSALKEHFDPFIKDYATGLKKIKTFKELKTYFCVKIDQLEKQFQDEKLGVNQKKVCPNDHVDISQQSERVVTTGTLLDPGYQPAMSFVQLVKVEDQLILLSAQRGDTIVFVEMQDGTVEKTQEANRMGVGNKMQKVSIRQFDITGAKRVIGFSDGIGEFITFDELKEIVKETPSKDLFDRLKEKATSRNTVDPRMRGANGALLKPYDKEVSSLSDDMSFFVLDV
jgi:hypothetical protein